MIYVLVKFQRRTQDSEYEVIGGFKSFNLARVGMFDALHREREGYPFVYQMEFTSDSKEGFFVIPSNNGIPDRDIGGFVLNADAVFYTCL